MSTTTDLMTADELLTMPHHENGNDFRYELIRGELKRMAPTGGTHGILCARLSTALSQVVEANDLGVVFGAETGFVVERGPDTVLGADVTFVRHERLKAVENIDKYLPFAPDLASAQSRSSAASAAARSRWSRHSCTDRTAACSASGSSRLDPRFSAWSSGSPSRSSTLRCGSRSACSSR